MDPKIGEILKSVAENALAAVEKAKAAKPGEKKPGEKPGEKKPGEEDMNMSKAAAKGKAVRAVAEKLLSVANKMEEAGGPPSADAIKQLKALQTELGGAIERYPSPKRATKSVDMSAEDFQAHAEKEVSEAVESGDTERLELLQNNLESVGEQASAEEPPTIFKVAVFTDPAQQKTTEAESPVASASSGDWKVMGAFKDAVSGLTEAITALKAGKVPPRFQPGGGKKPGEEEEPGKKGGGESETEKQGIKCPKCGAMNKPGATACEKCGATLKAKSEKSDSDQEPVWPTDMNRLRQTKSEAEGWGSVQKSGDDAVDFGPDPQECRE